MKNEKGLKIISCFLRELLLNREDARGAKLREGPSRPLRLRG
jgi:hypothetical protein